MAELTTWLRAARPRTLPAAIAPVLVGSGLAAGDSRFRVDAFLGALFGALAIQVAANFANDTSDAARGADPPSRVGPTRMVASGLITSRRMWMATFTAIGAATLAGVYLISIAGWVVAAIGISSILAMLGYVGGPIPYGYRALGEAAVFVFFGLVATVGTRYVHDQSVDAAAWWLGVVMGSLAAAILVANNLRDRSTDQEVGKRTLAVVLGDRGSRHLFAGLVLVAFVLIAAGPLLDITPPLTWLALLVAPVGARVVGSVHRASTAGELIPVLGATARLQLLVGIVLAAGAALTRV